jgi:uncharacterized membrane protein (UPF0127 family)
MDAHACVAERREDDPPEATAGGTGPLPLIILAAVITVVIIFVALDLLQTVKEPEDERVRVSFLLDDGSTVDFKCEVADNPFERSEGLQHREDLDQGSGMLFIYEDAGQRNFIMPNMNFPLDIIFISEDGTVLNVEEAEPEQPGTPREEYVRYPSDGDAMYVVEINQGLSGRYGIGPGATFTYDEWS